MRFGLCSMQGWRCGQEDDHLALEVDDKHMGGKGLLYAVWDGHGGKEVAEYAKTYYKDVLIGSQLFKEGKYKEALIESFKKFDKQVGEKDFGNDTGCTSNVVYVTKDKIYCANIGDSRSVLYTGG